MNVVNRISLIVLGRVLARVSMIVLVFFGIMILVESLNANRFATLSAVGGTTLAVLGLIVPAVRWSIGALPITVLMGTMAAMLDLQQRQELTVMKSTGLSLWRIVWLPIVVALLLSTVASVAVETWTIVTDRAMNARTTRVSGPLWIEQQADGVPYILRAERVRSSAPHLEKVSIFDVGGNRARIVAESATLSAGKWILADGTRYIADNVPESFASLDIGTGMTFADLDLQLSQARDLTIGELMSAATGNVTSPELRAVSMTSLYRAFSRPVMVIGAMLIAFALTARYRRRGDYSGAMLQGVIVGFVIFVLSEMAIRAGNSMMITPFAATAGPALVSVLAGATALLFLEDGYA